tara:strand:+ start:691 stop:831 length:141 start_codon:yes stop_codon:yes gene_type:complete
MAVAHIARVIFGAEIYFFGFSLPYLLCVLIAIGVPYLGLQSLNYRD